MLDVFEPEDMRGKAKVLWEKLKGRFEAWQKRYDIIGEIRGLSAMLGLARIKGAGRGGKREVSRFLPRAGPDHPGLQYLQQRRAGAGLPS